MSNTAGSPMYPEMIPGRCKKCKQPALRYKNGVPASQRLLMSYDWIHAGIGDCPYKFGAEHFPQRELDEAFEPTPEEDVIQYEVRYFDTSLGNTYRHSSGISGYTTLSCEERAKYNADKSTDGNLKSAYVYRVVNGQPDSRPFYVGTEKN